MRPEHDCYKCLYWTRYADDKERDLLGRCNLISDGGAGSRAQVLSNDGKFVAVPDLAIFVTRDDFGCDQWADKVGEG